MGVFGIFLLLCVLCFGGSCHGTRFGLEMISNRLNSLQAMESDLLASTNDTVRQLCKMNELLTQLLQTQSAGQHSPLVPIGASCRNAPSRRSGIYQINPEFPFQEPMTVLCEQQYEGGGWTVIQRRTDGSVDFFRDWQDYKRGFGTLHGEFWLGLEQIHRLTNVAPHELAILLEDFDGTTAVARYDRFRIGAESLSYKMLELGSCMPCSAGNSLHSHLLERFSTYDRDNDRAKFNCAEAYRGGWWHFFCHHAHLNGKYLKGRHADAGDAQGIVWMQFHNRSLKSSVMMIRPTEHVLLGRN